MQPIPVDAAAVIPVRHRDPNPAGGRGLEVLLLRRNAHARFMPGAYVFPGGAIEASDAAFNAVAEDVINASAASTFQIGAIRECFEESGLLYAYDERGELVDFHRWPSADVRTARDDIYAGRLALADLFRRYRLRLAADRLRYFSRWITPVESPRRFDTRFYVAVAPPAQTAELVGDEMSDLIWTTPAAALAAHAEGSMRVMHPTRVTLTELAAFGDVDALREFAAKTRAIEPITPRLADVPPDERPPSLRGR